VLKRGMACIMEGIMLFSSALLLRIWLSSVRLSQKYFYYTFLCVATLPLAPAAGLRAVSLSGRREHHTWRRIEKV
jgi:hypothetical protein